MQWLIDLVIEAIGVPPCYIDRGDAAGTDFERPAFATDGAWHDLDLSGIVPAGAVAVAFTTEITSPIAQLPISFRKDGNANVFNTATTRTQIANIAITNDLMVACSTDRKIEYMAVGLFWTTISVTIKGWWL